MRFPITLSLYISKIFLVRLAIVLSVVSVIIIFSSIFEFMRVSYGKEIPFRVILKLAFLKYPYLIQRTVPFIILFASTFTFLYVARTAELVVMKATGISIWQFLAPILSITLLIGILMTVVFSYVSSSLLSKHEKITQKYLRDVPQTLLVSKSGLWLRENNKQNNIIIYAKYYTYQEEMSLHDIKFFILSHQNVFEKRIDAVMAKLQPGYWQLNDVRIRQENRPAEYYNMLEFPTKLVKEQLQDSFATPEMIPFIELPYFINMLKEAGFSAIKYSLYYYRLLLQPIFMCTMVLMAASFALPLPRKQKVSPIIALGLIIGFIVYFVVDLVAVLGLSGKIPLILAASSPIIISMLITTAVVLHLEDG
ncbi:Lipopolysaccharide export system permease protein lptG [Rickettsiales bacterium Ac37b]|nr:Lipopolysaccharide export system permease protein lptG [Rickettsiales bacterium Ac37b]